MGSQEGMPSEARKGEGGAIAQLVERVLCKHQVVGSIPSGSTTLLRPKGYAGCPAKPWRSRAATLVIVDETSFPPALAGWADDIVKEGSVRRHPRLKDGPEKTSLSGKYKAHVWRCPGSLEPGRHSNHA